MDRRDTMRAMKRTEGWVGVAALSLDRALLGALAGGAGYLLLHLGATLLH